MAASSLSAIAPPGLRRSGRPLAGLAGGSRRAGPAFAVTLFDGLSFSRSPSTTIRPASTPARRRRASRSPSAMSEVEWPPGLPCIASARSGAALACDLSSVASRRRRKPCAKQAPASGCSESESGRARLIFLCFLLNVRQPRNRLRPGTAVASGSGMEGRNRRTGFQFALMWAKLWLLY